MVWQAVRGAFGHRFGAAVGLTAGGLLLGLALLSYVPDDPVPLLSSGSDRTSNLLGPVGAVVAEIAFQLVGLVAFAAPALMILGGLRRFRPPDPSREPVRGVRTVLVASLGVSAAGLLGLVQPAFQDVEVTRIPWGGYLGALLEAGLSSALGPVGTGITLAAFALVATGAIRGFGTRDVASSEHGQEAFHVRPIAWTRRSLGALRRRRERRATARRFVARVQKRSRGATPAPAAERARPAPKPTIARTLPFRKPSSPAAVETGDWELPSLQIFTRRSTQPGPARRVLESRRKVLEEACRQHRIQGEVVRIQPGPVVTTFEYRLGEGQALNRLKSLREEICMALSATTIRVERVRGRDVVGIEIPNQEPAVVGLRELLEDPCFREEKGALPVAIGRLVDGTPLVKDLGEMPHLLVAGATGAGKSVLINTLLCSLLTRRTPDQLRLILIDPKRVELRPYRKIPHLLTPVVLDPEKSKIVLQQACRELDRRTRLLEEHGVRNITGYNRYVQSLRESSSKRRGKQEELPSLMPHLVIVIDELADLFLHARAEVTPAIQRLLALGRAEGIHLVLATQRPSTDIISGTLKANLPTRIAFRVATQVDSKVILDRGGAELLLGKGDMLLMRAGADMPRAQGAFVTEKEVEQLARYWSSAGEPVFDDAMLESAEAPAATNGSVRAGAPGSQKADAMLAAAREFVIREQKASTSSLQSEFKLGYQRSRRIVIALEKEGVIGPERGARPREVLVQP